MNWKDPMLLGSDELSCPKAASGKRGLDSSEAAIYLNNPSAGSFSGLAWPNAVNCKGNPE